MPLVGRSGIVDQWSDVYSVLFGGTDEYAEDAGKTALDYERDEAFSISLWVKPTLAATQYLVSKMKGSGPYNGVTLTYTSTKKLKLALSDASSNYCYRISTADDITLDTWQHVVATYDGSETYAGIKLYIDGAELSYTNGSEDLAGSIKGDWPARLAASGSGDYATLNLDEVTIWDKELSLAEAQELYNSGSPANPLAHSAAANLVNYWPMGDGDTHPTLQDNQGSADLTMTNMEEADIEEDVP